MIGKLAIAFSCLALSGCGENVLPEPSKSDQCMRREIFLQCMASLPKGPEKTTYNDWDEVVESCEKAAWKQSYRKLDQIKMECRP